MASSIGEREPHGAADIEWSWRGGSAAQKAVFLRQ
jgi:hypothetical protein